MNSMSGFKKWLVILVALILIAIMGYSMGGRTRITIFENILGNVITPVQKVLKLTGDSISSKVKPIKNIWKYEEQLQKLTEENSKLKKQVIENALSKNEYNELKRLEKLLDYDKNMDMDKIAACNIISKDPGNWFSMFIIDKGLNDGIDKNSTVITGEGLVGLVYEVGDNWAKVISIVDNKSSVGIEVISGEKVYDGVISGTIDGKLTGYLFDPNAEVSPGDQIISSGIGIFAKGIVIGSLEEVIIDDDSLLKNLSVNPNVDFKNLNIVMVIKN